MGQIWGTADIKLKIVGISMAFSGLRLRQNTVSPSLLGGQMCGYEIGDLQPKPGVLRSRSPPNAIEKIDVSDVFSSLPLMQPRRRLPAKMVWATEAPARRSRIGAIAAEIGTCQSRRPATAKPYHHQLVTGAWNFAVAT